MPAQSQLTQTRLAGMRRRVYALSITIILAAATGAFAVASTTRPAESSRRVSWRSRRGDILFTAAAWQRKDGKRCISGGVERHGAEGADLSTCLPKVGRHPHGIIVMQCALHRALVAGIGSSTTRSARVHPKHGPVVHADAVRASVLNGATFVAHAFAFRELPARIALRDTAGTVVARVRVAQAPAAPCDDGSSIYRYF